MSRTVLSGLALVLLVPGLALAQEGRSGRGHPFPDGKLPPGVRRMERPAPHGEQVPAQAIQRLAAAVQGLSRRVERLEKGFQGLIQRMRQAHAQVPTRPDARRTGRAQHRPERAARGPRGDRRGGARFQRWMRNPRVRAFAQRMRGRFHEAAPMLRRALMARQGARPGHPDRRMDRPRGPRDARPEMMGRYHGGPAVSPRGPAPKKGPEAVKAARAAKAKMASRAKAAKAARSKAGAAKARNAAAPAHAELVKKARHLAAENAKLKAELKKLQAQMKKLIEAVKKRHSGN